MAKLSTLGQDDGKGPLAKSDACSVCIRFTLCKAFERSQPRQEKAPRSCTELSKSSRNTHPAVRKTDFTSGPQTGPLSVSGEIAFRSPRVPRHIYLRKLGS